MTSQASNGPDMTFVPTTDGINPKASDHPYTGNSLLRYSSEIQELSKEIPEYPPMKKKPVGQVKY